MLPEFPSIPDILHILNMWDYSVEASEVTSFFQQLFSRLPPYFVAFFSLIFLFIVIPLIIKLMSEIL